MTDLRDILNKIAADDKPSGWLGASVSPELGARMKLLHRYIRNDDLAEDGIERDPHITIAYGLANDLTSDKVAQLLRTAHGSKIRLGNMQVFDNPDNDVLNFEVLSDDLKNANQRIKDEIGLPGATFKEYNPHITVAYLKKGLDKNRYKLLEKLLKGKEFNIKSTKLRVGDREFNSDHLLAE
jgi:2'-5' RNA ligase